MTHLGDDIPVLDEMDAVIDALVDPTSEDMFYSTRYYGRREMAASALARIQNGAGGAGPELIEEIVLDEDTAEIAFTDIPQTFRHLQLWALLRGTKDDAGTDIRLEINGGVGNLHADQLLTGSGGSAGAGGGTGNNNSTVGFTTGATATPGEAGILLAEFLFYTDTEFDKQVISRAGTVNAVFGSLRHALVTFRDNVPITEIAILPDTAEWVAGSRAELYGLGSA